MSKTQPVLYLSPHFSLPELTFSQTAVRLGIDNKPDPGIIANLSYVAEQLEIARIALNNHPIIITSCYRSPALNRVTPGSSKTSAHTRGLAADIICPMFGSPLDVCRALAASTIPYDQIIYEHTWCHIGFTHASPPRRELLTAKFSPDGTVSYEIGLVQG